jgi:diaminohydroxyphosphoribosylaminopyrimidine deaminase / 5-amino-6-(5-phosphoribosylamino)uracil reductase
VEIDAMRRAISLARRGLASASPNPPVGCVILDAAGDVVGQGYHRRKGEPHAEVNALADAGPRAQGGTAIVTLEPCNHHGRTPPCHQALIAAGIRRVLVAVIDPTSRGIGGVARLRDAHIQVEVGLLADEARMVVGRWLQALATGRPHVHWITDPAGTQDMTSYDIVVNAPDGVVVETVPGAHGQNLQLPRHVDLSEPWLRRLYEGGVRTALLFASADVAEPLLEAGLVSDSSSGSFYVG